MELRGPLFIAEGGVPRVLRRDGHGAASTVIERARRGRLCVGVVLAMLNVQRAQRKGDGIDQGHELSAAARAG
jgi:hypothetical protein